MVEKLSRETIAQHAIVHTAMPAAHRPTIVDRSFELPRGLYIATVGCYLSFMLVTGLCFGNPGLILPMGVIIFLIIAGFGIPTIWTKLAPQSPVRAKSWARFQQDGITTISGHNSAAQASVQVLILPVLVLIWGVAVVTIAAIVS
ncbi:hypothetical protein GCM10009127_14840 [Alteraurantiacibacter aestuarii]|uniref:Uncharacterized protein n=1 Tax=Alteraurantiacibacter aestuarii TaxID=650004 RepID=A0A844ZQP8_9SPHN|nr:hypothetical protein [Alteraurantiacibacter aestuarii]MXO87929.1 hypothetical protein [Alteraurantiacibacter aestuarii]